MISGNAMNAIGNDFRNAMICNWQWFQECSDMQWQWFQAMLEKNWKFVCPFRQYAMSPFLFWFFFCAIWYVIIQWLLSLWKRLMRSNQLNGLSAIFTTVELHMAWSLNKSWFMIISLVLVCPPPRCQVFSCVIQQLRKIRRLTSGEPFTNTGLLSEIGSR